MATWFVSRHPGALDWASRQGIHIDRSVDHLDITAVISGDQVIGTLPIHMAAAVCERDARYLHLEITVPRERRGQELDCGELQALGARLTEFRVWRCADVATRDDRGLTPGQDQIHVRDPAPVGTGQRDFRLDRVTEKDEGLEPRGTVKAAGSAGDQDRLDPIGSVL